MLETTIDPAMWTYRLVFNARKGEQPLVKEEYAAHNGKALFTRPNSETLRMRRSYLRRTCSKFNKTNHFGRLPSSYEACAICTSFLKLSETGRWQVLKVIPTAVTFFCV